MLFVIREMKNWPVYRGWPVYPSKKVPRKNRDVFRGASLGVFRAFFENEKRSKTLKDAQKREK